MLGVPLLHSLLRTRENPRISLRRIGIIVTFLLGTQCFGVLGAWWKFSREQSDAGHLRFRRSADVLSFGLACVVAPTRSLYRLVAILLL
jgi:hypothetical protein